MPRTISDSFKQAMFEPESTKVALLLLTISPAIDSPSSEIFVPLRICLNTQPILSRGDVYQPFPFEITLPLESATELPRVTLKVDNIDRQILVALRGLSRPPQISIEIVASDAPDTVEIGPFNFTWRGLRYTAQAVEGELELEDILSEPFPADRFTPTKFPSLC